MTPHPASHPLSPFPPPIQIWSDGQREMAVSRLSAFARYEATGTPLAAKAWRRLGAWRREMAESEPYSLSRAAQTLDCFSRSIAEAPDNYKACHAWAMVHFEAVQQLPWAEAVQFVAPAVRRL
jgi:FKBP12-rapamycin complex-associated protein